MSMTSPDGLTEFTFRCKKCGKEKTIMYPGMYTYKLRGKKSGTWWFCSWTCYHTFKEEHERKMAEIHHQNRSDATYNGFAQRVEDRKEDQYYLDVPKLKVFAYQRNQTLKGLSEAIGRNGFYLSSCGKRPQCTVPYSVVDRLSRILNVPRVSFARKKRSDAEDE